ncbi:MAG: TlpA family protein disulfide reductase [Xanthomonadaceae bacterium]|nr:TlpA family protein disulfide reductase [Xanthomonadaceae bacterium]
MALILAALAAVMLTLFAGAPAANAQGLDLSPYRGKIVLVDFWASWCTPCRHSFPWLDSMQKRYENQGLVVLGVNVDRERAAAERFLRDVPVQFEILYDPQGVLATKYELLGMPSSFVFGPDGKLLITHVGFKTSERDEREREIARLLNEHVRDQP